MKLPLWIILVPTVRPNTNGQQFFTTRYHRVWDARVRSITGGLTIMPPTKGQWVSPSGAVFVERMIPVMIAATEEQMDRIVAFTMEYYKQEAVFSYLLSSDVRVAHHPTRRNES